MTPLEAAQAIIDARARATAGEWIQGWYVGGGQYIHREEDRRMGRGRIACMGNFHTTGGNDSAFTVLAANHAAAVAQAYKDAMQDNARLRAALEESRQVIGYYVNQDENPASIDAALEDTK